MELQTISRSRVSFFAKLAKKKHRDSERMFVAEGGKCVEDTLARFELVALVATQQWLGNHPELTERYADRVLTASARDLEKISQMATPPAVIAVYRYPERFGREVPPPSEDELYLALDGVQDPGNLGTIVRAADWFGVRRIYASRQTADIFSAKAVQATMGAISRVEVVYCELPELIAGTKDVSVFGTLLDGEDIYQADFDGRNGLIVLGNEGNGLTEEVRSLVTDRLLIPPYPADATDHPESLNVGVSAAIVLAEFRRRLTIPQL